MEANRDAYSVTMMCELLSVSRSGLHDARRREPSARAADAAKLVSEIRRAQVKHLTRHHAGDVVAASQGRVEQDPNRRALKQATGSETNGWGGGSDARRTAYRLHRCGTSANSVVHGAGTHLRYAGADYVVARVAHKRKEASAY